MAEGHGFREILPSSGYEYTQPQFLFFEEKKINAHETYWAEDHAEVKSLIGIRDTKAYFFQMSKDFLYFDNFRDSADSSFIHVRCISK